MKLYNKNPTEIKYSLFCNKNSQINKNRVKELHERSNTIETVNRILIKYSSISVETFTSSDVTANGMEYNYKRTNHNARALARCIQIVACRECNL